MNRDCTSVQGVPHQAGSDPRISSRNQAVHCGRDWGLPADIYCAQVDILRLVLHNI